MSCCQTLCSSKKLTEKDKLLEVEGCTCPSAPWLATPVGFLDAVFRASLLPSRRADGGWQRSSLSLPASQRLQIAGPAQCANPRRYRIISESARRSLGDLIIFTSGQSAGRGQRIQRPTDDPTAPVSAAAVSALSSDSSTLVVVEYESTKTA